MTEHQHPELDDDELLERFATNTLPAFPHEEHLHVVFVHAARHPEAETLRFVRTGIQAMAAANGNPGAYHETRTAAWVRLIVAARDGFDDDFAAFLAAHPDLLRRDRLADHYSDELLTGDAARAAFVEPDRLPLPR